MDAPTLAIAAIMAAPIAAYVAVLVARSPLPPRVVPEAARRRDRSALTASLRYPGGPFFGCARNRPRGAWGLNEDEARPQAPTLCDIAEGRYGKFTPFQSETRAVFNL